MPAVLALLLLISGCAIGTGGQEADAAPLGCDELVPSDDLVAAALTDVGGVEPSPMSAMPPLEFDPLLMLLPAAGGLRCSWNAGAPALDYTSDWGYLSVEALPFDGDAVNVRDADGEPIASSTSIGGYDAVAACRGWAFECLVVVACALEGGRLFIVPGAGDLMEGMLRTPDFDGVFAPLEDRTGYPALGRVSGPGGMVVVLTIAEDAYVIDAGDAVAYARDILTARVADYAGPQRDESLQAPNIATAEAEGLALVEGTAAELGLTIATTYPPERRRCEHPDGFPGVLSEVVVTTAASSTPDEELFELVDRYWSSRAFTVYRPDNGIAAEGAAGGLISTVYLTASEFGGGPSIRVQSPCAVE